MKIGVLKIPAPVRMTPCPPCDSRLYGWGHLDRENDPLSSLTPTPDFVDWGHLDGENDILGRQVLNKS